MPDFDYQEDQMAVESQVDDIRERIDRIPAPKGQLILKANSKVFIWTKNRTKIFPYYCPGSLKWIKSKKKTNIISDDK